MAEPVTFQETNEGSTSTVTVVETDEHDAQWMKKSCTSKWIKQMHTNDNSPLNGIRVLDLTRIVAGPYCTMILSDLGAEVIKIEKPGTGDESRKWGPPFIANTEESCYFVSLNRNKKSICIDLKLNEGRNILYNLAKESDVLVENFVPGKLADLQLGYDDFQKIAPHLIYCSITGYGSVGPYKNRPGYDVIAASIGGLLHITGPKDGDPVKVGVAVTDLATGLYAHGAIIAAIWKRSKTGRGQKIDCNLLSTQVANLINVGSNYLNTGKEPTKWGTAHESIVPYEAFPTKDGYFTIGTGSDKQFLDLCTKIGYPELGHNEKYLTNRLRVKHREELILFLSNVMKSKTNEEWYHILKNSSFPCGPVNSLKQTFEDAHLKDIGIVKTIAHPTAGKVKVVGPPEVPRVTLKLRKPKTDRKVQWTTGTVDNEHMNKKKSKCCCIYDKPRKFGESSSEDSDEECDHCHGHVDKKKRNQSTALQGSSEGDSSNTIAVDSSQTVTLDN